MFQLQVGNLRGLHVKKTTWNIGFPALVKVRQSIKYLIIVCQYGSILQAYRKINYYSEYIHYKLRMGWDLWRHFPLLLWEVECYGTCTLANRQVSTRDQFFIKLTEFWPLECNLFLVPQADTLPKLTEELSGPLKMMQVCAILYQFSAYQLAYLFSVVTHSSYNRVDGFIALGSWFRRFANRDVGWVGHKIMDQPSPLSCGWDSEQC